MRTSRWSIPSMPSFAVAGALGVLGALLATGTQPTMSTAADEPGVGPVTMVDRPTAVDRTRRTVRDATLPPAAEGVSPGPDASRRSPRSRATQVARAATAPAGTAGTAANTTPTTATGAALVVDPPELDLGTVPLGRDVPNELVIRNTSADPVRILAVRTTCGCTAAEPADSVLEPGEQTSLTVVFSPNKVGRQAQFVRLVTDAPAPAVVSVRVAAEVVLANATGQPISNGRLPGS